MKGKIRGLRHTEADVYKSHTLLRHDGQKVKEIKVTGDALTEPK